MQKVAKYEIMIKKLREKVFMRLLTISLLENCCRTTPNMPQQA